jgi:hypothetical protein
MVQLVAFFFFLLTMSNSNHNCIIYFFNYMGPRTIIEIKYFGPFTGTHLRKKVSLTPILSLVPFHTHIKMMVMIKCVLKASVLNDGCFFLD